MSNKNKYSVILPTYNEAGNIAIILGLILEMAEDHKLDFEVIVIEDNSPDGTAQIVEQLQKVYPNKIYLHKRPGKMGLGSAYMDGLKFCKGNFVVLMDADLSHHPKYLPEFIKKQIDSNADIVTGSRYLAKGGVYGWNFKRKLTSCGANFLARFLLGSPCSDMTGSFRLYKKQVIEQIMANIFSKGYAFQMEIVVRAQHNKFSVEEVPIVFVDRIFGESKLGVNEIVTYLKGVWKLLWTF